MRIENHRLVDPAEGITLEYREDPDAKRAPRFTEPPKLVVIHYAVTTSAQATAAVLEAREYVSAHVTLDATGRVIQQVPFSKIAWHAGTSLYKGRPKVSTFSLGIEISNPGPLELRGSQYYTTYGKLWTGGVVEAWHPNTPGRGWKYWAEYSQVELDLTAHLCALFRQEYGVEAIVGHDEIAPGRKSDPGPAFPMQWLRETVFPGADPSTTNRPATLEDALEVARAGRLTEADHDEKTKPDPPRNA